MRSAEKIKLLSERMGESYSVENFISDADRQELISLFNNHIEQQQEKKTGPTTLSINLFEDHPVVIKLFKKIKNVIGDCDIFGGNFFYTDLPYVIHNDDKEDLPDAYKVALLPLEVYPEDKEIGNASLVVFEQTYFGGPVKLFKNGPEQISFYNKPKYNYDNVNNLQDKNIPKLITDKLFPHLRAEWLEGLSIENKLSWNKGSLIVFDTLKFHASTDFRKQGISAKLGLSIFTKKNV